jgi:phosphatidate cytidylyltransferase
MNFDQSGVPLKNICTLFCALLIIGACLCIPLFKFDIKKFFKSKLFIKIVYWIPIFLFFIAIIYANNWIRSAALISLLLIVFFELKKFIIGRYKLLVLAYFIVFALSFCHFYLIENHFQKEFIGILTTICFATVLADVFAFFFGSYLGFHKLPKSLNNNKSWEGVAGEFIGAMFGVLLVDLFVSNVVTGWIFIPIGLGAIIGDLFNSYVKRKLNIKQWSNALPGHGGFADRFSSIAASCAMTFYFLIVVL